MAEVGFEMMIYSFGSGFSIETSNETDIQRIADDIAYARSKGIEVNGSIFQQKTKFMQKQLYILTARNSLWFRDPFAYSNTCS